MINFLVKIFFALSLSIIFSHNISANNLQLKGELTQGGIVVGFYENAKKVSLEQKKSLINQHKEWVSKLSLLGHIVSSGFL